MLEAKLKMNLLNISSLIARTYGDHGSCVMGYNLLLDGKPVVPQPAQGSSTCEFVYSTLTRIMKANGVDESRITINYGVMD
jgi:hypothetical protein